MCQTLNGGPSSAAPSPPVPAWPCSAPVAARCCQRADPTAVPRPRTPPPPVARPTSAPSTSSSRGSRTSSSPAQYIADKKGYYTDAGFSAVELHRRRPDASSRSSIVASGKAVVGISAPDITGAGHPQGCAAQDHRRAVPEEPVLRHVARRQPDHDPRGHVGKKIGVQAANEPVWDAFLKANEHRRLEDRRRCRCSSTRTPLVARRGRRLVLVRHQRAEPAQGPRASTRSTSCSPTTATRSSPRPTWSCDRDASRTTATSSRRSSRPRSRAGSESIKDPTLGAKLAVENYGKDLGLDDRGADARVRGAERAHRAPPTPRRTASSRSATS